MKRNCYLLAILFLENGKKGHQNVYVSVNGEFILSKVVDRICQDYGYQKVTIMSRIEVTDQEFVMNQTLNHAVCCFVFTDLDRKEGAWF